MKKTIKILAALALVCLLAAPAALAHDMWITLDNPQVNQPLKALVGYGHAFPASEGTEMERLVPAVIYGANGEIATKPGQALDFVSDKPLAKGSYVVVSGRTAQWWSKTPEGYKDLPKSKCPEAIKCLRSAKYAKTILNLGGAKGDVSQVTGQTLEIVPLANPAAMGPGGEVPVQVLYKGQPLTGSEIFATYAGFSQHKNTFAFAAKTDKEGKAFVKPWHPGLWVVVAKHRIPFPDPKECDEDAFAATLTFTVK